MKKNKLLFLTTVAIILILQSCDSGATRVTSPYVISSMSIHERSNTVVYKAHSVNCTRTEKWFEYFYITFMDSIGKYNYGDTIVIVKKGD